MRDGTDELHGGAAKPDDDDLDLAGIQRRLDGVRGRDYWRALDEIARSSAFLSFLRREYPSQVPRLGGDVERRDFLRLMGASLATVGLGACTRQPDEKIVPYARTPEATIPGKPRYFATTMPLGGSALGLVVESHEGRPTKVEGNPDHPSSRGATDAFAQAAILSLYDPDRSHSVLRNGQISTWEDFVLDLGARLDRMEAVRGRGIRILLGDAISPSAREHLRVVQERFPDARWHRWSPVHRDAERAGAELAFGRDVSVRYRLDRADVVLSLDAEFLASGCGGVRNAREFAARRRVRHDTTSISRFFAVESAPTLSGANADERLAVRPSEVEGFARMLARELGVAVQVPRLSEPAAGFLRVVADELRAGAGASVVIPGAEQSPAVHALAHAINAALGNVGQTVEYAEPLEPLPTGVTQSLTELTEDLRANRVEILVMIGGNPVYDAPSDLDFAEALKQCPVRVHVAEHEDETSELCHWHVPRSHFLESWNDALAHDGTLSLVQPLIAPLHGGKSEHDILALFAGRPGVSGHDFLKAFHRGRSGLSEEAFEGAWHRALHDGIVADSALAPLDVAPGTLDLGPAPDPDAGLEIALRPDAAVFDGRFANNGWLQEMPRPLTRLTWDNAAWVSAATAAELGVRTGEVLEVRAGERSVEAAAWIMPGHPDGTVTLHLGYGRRRAGRVGAGAGFDAYPLRTSYEPWNLRGASARRTGRSHAFASVQDHARMEGRDIVRVASFDRFRSDPEHTWHDHPEVPSLYPGFEYEGRAWGMVIDLSACIGCNACMIACQSENNIPVVGKQEVSRGREMHWIRVDRYYEEGPGAVPRVLHQPVPCMHCEEAPCEVVCPVGATVHSDEGLNEMVYNRCVGTRYCSNNCPYKVRRFNFFLYADFETESLQLANNPDVTVRSRGVMEKCTYCVQRINHARIEAKKEDRPIADGEIRTACQQVCPTQAIVFGDINDPASAVSRLRQEPQHYGLLAELGTRPRTTYLAKLDNPRASTAAVPQAHGDDHE